MEIFDILYNNYYLKRSIKNTNSLQKHGVEDEVVDIIYAFCIFKVLGKKRVCSSDVMGADHAGGWCLRELEVPPRKKHGDAF